MIGEPIETRMLNSDLRTQEERAPLLSQAVDERGDKNQTIGPPHENSHPLQARGRLSSVAAASQSPARPTLPSLRPLKRLTSPRSRSDIAAKFDPFSS